MRNMLRVLTVVVVLPCAVPAMADARIDARPRRLADGRIAISSPTEIGWAGSYVLTKSIERSGGSAVRITAPHVKLDLNGFTVTCDRPQGPGTDCILVEASFVEVINGFVVARDDPDDPPVIAGVAARPPGSALDETLEGLAIRNVTVTVTGGGPGIDVRGSRSVTTRSGATLPSAWVVALRSCADRAK